LCFNQRYSSRTTKVVDTGIRPFWNGRVSGAGHAAENGLLRSVRVEELVHQPKEVLCRRDRLDLMVESLANEQRQ